MTVKKDPVEEAIEFAKPILTKLSFGTVMGYCSGMALKKIGKAMAFIIGVGFVSLQTAAYYGYLTVEWNKIASDAVKQVDTNQNGSIDAEDLKVYWAKLKKILTANVPSSGGFSLGFLWGVRSG
jgi:uncharacterized membrane protein (Fun14 family)